jgi:3' terminal RNA ribose 2'-O-methyltransferase Hen1
MILTITTTHVPATDLGYLLHKNPSREQSFSLNFGRAHVFYPEATEDRCSASLLLDIDPIGLVRNRRSSAGSAFALYPYVNDRPYAASSFLSVAIAEVYSSALNGRSKDRPELVDTPLPLHVRIGVLPSRGGEPLLRRLFEPLGYSISAEGYILDEEFPEWGMSRYLTVELTHTIPLRSLLTHLYVLIPVLDDEKHYWVGEDEVEKLLRHGEGWLAAHPERELITRRYLKHRGSLARTALAQLAEGDNLDPDEAESQHDSEERVVEETISLHTQRLAMVCDVLVKSGAGRVLDLGCGEGKLLSLLMRERQFTEIVGMDVSHRSLQIAAERLGLNRLPEQQRGRIALLHGSLIYRDARLAGYDAAAVVEVIEHLEPFRLEAFERTLFESARPGMAVITTPNSEYNVKWPTLPAGKFRHQDHRFEWTRAEFEDWGSRLAQRYGYTVTFHPVGPVDEVVGAPTQMGVFVRG